jgi:hypothetical protein
MIRQLEKLLLGVRTSLGLDSPEQQFRSSFPVFQREQDRKLRQRITELYGGRQRLGSTYGTTGRGDPVSGRYQLYREHAERMGKDFIDSFKAIIAAHCSYISAESTRTLLQQLDRMYSRAMEDARRSDSRYLQSIGRPNDIDAFYIPTRGIYASALSRHRDALQSEISQCNLTASRQKLQSRRKRVIGLALQVLSYAITFLLGVVLGKLIAGK